jgi:hypothetical protein
MQSLLNLLSLHVKSVTKCLSPYVCAGPVRLHQPAISLITADHVLVTMCINVEQNQGGY